MSREKEEEKKVIDPKIMNSERMLEAGCQMFTRDVGVAKSLVETAAILFALERIAYVLDKNSLTPWFEDQVRRGKEHQGSDA